MACYPAILFAGGVLCISYARVRCRAAMIPIVNLDADSTIEEDVAFRLVFALQKSGFALVRSKLVTPLLQSEALAAASILFGAGDIPPSHAAAVRELGSQIGTVVEHPTDPKVHVGVQLRNISCSWRFRHIAC